MDLLLFALTGVVAISLALLVAREGRAATDELENRDLARLEAEIASAEAAAARARETARENPDVELDPAFERVQREKVRRLREEMAGLAARRAGSVNIGYQGESTRVVRYRVKFLAHAVPLQGLVTWLGVRLVSADRDLGMLVGPVVVLVVLAGLFTVPALLLYAWTLVYRRLRGTL